MIAQVSWFNKRFGLAEDENKVRYFLHHTRMDDETQQAANEDTFEGKLIEFEIGPGATARGMTAKNIHFI